MSIEDNTKYIENTTRIYIEKENYITVHSNPEIWKNHANYNILKASKEYIRGVCGDLGCNHGSCTLLLDEFKPEAIYGFDINMKALDVAYQSALNLKSSTPINFICTNLLKIPIKDDFFDFLVSFHTLEHIYPIDVDTFVSEIYRVLKPDCNILISIPYDHAYPDIHHVGFYKEDSIIELFEKHNFITIECFKDDRFNEKNLLTAIFKKPN